MILARFFTPDVRPSDQQKALDGMATLMGDSRYHRVVSATGFLATKGGYGYRDALCNVWGVDLGHQNQDLVILEQDLVPSCEQLEAFEACPYEVCVQAYRIYPCSTRLPNPVYAHRVKDSSREPPFRWIEDGEEWADRWGLGLARISENVCRDFPLDRFYGDSRWHHTNCDTLLSQYLNEYGIRAHVHWPEVPHFHTGETV